MVSCSNYTGGFFSAYRHLADRDDLDFVVHLGDYRHEYGNGADRYGPESLAVVRDHDPATEKVTLSDYRRRHALDKADQDLSRLLSKYAFITTWDDHEVSNDSWREGRRSTSPRARARTSRGATAATRRTTSGCRSACPSGDLPRRRASTVGCSSGRWPT